MLPITAIHLLTYNEKSIETCLNSLLSQEGFVLGQNFFILASDNKSTNDLWEKLSVYKDKVSLFQNDENYGFARGHNLGIKKALDTGARYVFVANPDIVLEKDCLKKMVTFLEQDSTAGFATPRIYRANEKIEPIEPKTFDACGMYFNSDIRHLDRGSNEIDNGEYRKPQYVFGATGAALLFKKEFIEDCSFELDDTKELELFDNDFFLYREDAELSLRGQFFGWNCIYVPDAVVYHTRVVTPEKRKKIPKRYNLYSVRNRFLIQLNNFSPLLCIICLRGFLIRNFLVFLACITFERSSFPGIIDVFKLLPRSFKKRKYIFSKRRKSDLILKDWFFKKGLEGEDFLREDIPKKENTTSIIIINYNSGARLIKTVDAAKTALKSLSPNPHNKIIIIDNNSKSDKEILEEIKKDKDLVIIENKENLGFSGACNQGFKNSESDYVLILNPDVILKEHTIKNLSTALSSYIELGAIGASLLNKDLTPQFGFSARKLPSLSSTILELLGFAKFFPNNFITKNYLMKDDKVYQSYLEGSHQENSPYKTSDQPFLVEQPAGACLLIKREAYDKVGGFDERFHPAWHEDVDFCLRLKEKGYKLAILSSAQAIHEGGYSLNTMSRKDFLKIWYKNLNLYWEKHGNTFEKLIIKFLTKIACTIRTI